MLMSVMFASDRILPTIDDGPLELECRSIHLDVEKGQQARTDGLLSGNGDLSSYYSVSHDRRPNNRQVSALTPQVTLQGSLMP